MSVDALTREARDTFESYARPEERPPFRTYAAMATLFNAGFAGALLAAKRSRRLPERLETRDVILVGTASHKLSRLVAKDKITAFLRAPFTEYQGRGGPAEVEERARGDGVRRAVGELLICPYCLGLWSLRRLSRRHVVRAPRHSSGRLHADRSDPVGFPPDRLQGGRTARSRRHLEPASRRGARWAVVPRNAHGELRAKAFGQLRRYMSMFSNSEALSRASHELRTPLNAILGFGQLLAMDELNESQRHSVEQILAGGRHLLSLIDDLLDLSRVGDLSPEPTDIGEAVARAAALCQPLAAERSLTISVEIEDEPLTALADRRRLKQVLLNLISNGVKYNRPGGTLTLHAYADSDDQVRIEVIDTGRGLTQAEVDRVFVPFERLSAARRGIEGNGLGLAVSKTLAEAMDGAIEVASTPGIGSIFTLRLPATEPADRARSLRHRALAGVG